MLSRLETTYLGILRIIILVVATVALLAALIAFVSAVPALMQQAGLSHDEPVTGGTLADYIAERKATAPQAEASGPSESITASRRDIDPALSATARNIADYFSAASGGKRIVVVPKLEDSLAAQAANIPPGSQSAYFRDTERLSGELKISKGKPLTPEQVEDLFQWQQRRFVADLATRDGKRTSDFGRSMVKLYVAGYSFAAFISVVFIFLFVKIERNLRSIRMTHVEGDHA